MRIHGEKVLVTGADGFIGSHLVEGLVRRGAAVRALVLYNSLNSWGWLEDVPAEIRESIEVVVGDIRDVHCLREASSGCGAIFHLAALIAIPYSYRSPDSYVATNVQGTLNVLQAARERQVAKVMVTSTSEVYGTARYVPIDEGHPLQGQSPYAATKIGADQMALAFHGAYGVPVTVVRPFNTYGARQSARAVVPTVITQLLAGRRTIRLGNLHPTRDLVHIADTVEGMIRLAEAPACEGEQVNIATGVEISIGRAGRGDLPADRSRGPHRCRSGPREAPGQRSGTLAGDELKVGATDGLGAQDLTGRRPREDHRLVPPPREPDPLQGRYLQPVRTAP